MNATLFEMPAAVPPGDYWRVETCWKCGKGFTAASWDDRHEDYEGHDIHAKCCSVVSCRNTRIRAARLARITP